MPRQLLDLAPRDIAVLASALHTEAETLRSELDRRPWFANDVLRDPDVAEIVLRGTSPTAVAVSPLLFFAVMVHAAANDLADSQWVADWTGPKTRLPVFDVEPLLEFSEAPARLVFMAHLLAGFAAPGATPVPADRYNLDDLVDWLAAAEPKDRTVLLRQLGDLALFQAGVFPDSNGGSLLSVTQAEHLGHSVGMTAGEIADLVDPRSTTPGLDALEALGSAWYRAAADASERVPAVLRDIAVRVRPARRFLNHLADRYLQQLPLSYAP